MRRVVVTGAGIVSANGNNREEVLRSLLESRSGVRYVPEMRELGFRVPVAGLVEDLHIPDLGPRRLRTMSRGDVFAAVAAQEALQDAGLAEKELQNTRTGLILGTGAGAFNDAARAETLLSKHRNPSRLGARGLVKVLGDSAAINLATHLGVKGRCYSISSACTTGADCIGNGFELIRHGILDRCLCGGTEERGWNAFGFYAAGFGGAGQGAPVRYVEQPAEACRPYDRDRLGMMIPSEGAGVVILEDLDHALARGARCYAEVTGYGSANDGCDMFSPSGEGLERAVREALRSVESANGSPRIDYVNPHGAGTKVGDPVDVRIIREIFGTSSPLVSSTKPLNGHSQGAAGVHEAIFTLLMLHHGFVAPTINLENVDPECNGVRHVRSAQKVPLHTAMTFNTGLGGTNACLIFTKPHSG